MPDIPAWLSEDTSSEPAPQENNSIPTWLSDEPKQEEVSQGPAWLLGEEAAPTAETTKISPEEEPKEGLGLFGKGIGRYAIKDMPVSLIRTGQMLGKFLFKSHTAKQIQGAVDPLIERGVEKIKTGAESIIPVSEAEQGKFTYKLGAGTGSFAQNIATAIFAPELAVPSFFALGAGSAYDEVKNNPQWSEEKKEAYAIAQGGWEAISEKIGTDWIIKSPMGRGIKKAAANFFTEGLQELSQQFGSNIIDKVNGIDRKLSDGLLDSMLVGGILGGSVGGFISGNDINFNTVVTDEQKKAMADAGMTEDEQKAYVMTMYNKAKEASEQQAETIEEEKPQTQLALKGQVIEPLQVETATPLRLPEVTETSFQQAMADFDRFKQEYIEERRQEELADMLRKQEEEARFDEENGITQEVVDQTKDYLQQYEDEIYAAENAVPLNLRAFRQYIGRKAIKVPINEKTGKMAGEYDGLQRAYGFNFSKETGQSIDDALSEFNSINPEYQMDETTFIQALRKYQRDAAKSGTRSEVTDDMAREYLRNEIRKGEKIIVKEEEKKPEIKTTPERMNVLMDIHEKFKNSRASYEGGATTGPMAGKYFAKSSGKTETKWREELTAEEYKYLHDLNRYEKKQRATPETQMLEREPGAETRTPEMVPGEESVFDAIEEEAPLLEAAHGKRMKTKRISYMYLKDQMGAESAAPLYKKVGDNEIEFQPQDFMKLAQVMTGTDQSSQYGPGTPEYAIWIELQRRATEGRTSIQKIIKALKGPLRVRFGVEPTTARGRATPPEPSARRTPMPNRQDARAVPPEVLYQMIKTLGIETSISEKFRREGINGMFKPGVRIVDMNNGMILKEEKDRIIIMRALAGEWYDTISMRDLLNQFPADTAQAIHYQLRKEGIIDDGDFVTREYRGYETLDSLFKNKDGSMMRGISRDIINKLYEFIEAQKFDAADLSRTLGHEIGHFVDYSPDKTFGRGNILGRILSEAKFHQDVFVDENGHIKNAEIYQELKDLTQWWRPFNERTDMSYTKYRYSGVELYGDALSVYLNDPNIARQAAPKFFEALERYMYRKPEVKSALAELDKVRGLDSKGLTDYIFNNNQKFLSEEQPKILEEIWDRITKPLKEKRTLKGEYETMLKKQVSTLRPIERMFVDAGLMKKGMIYARELGGPEYLNPFYSARQIRMDDVMIEVRSKEYDQALRKDDLSENLLRDTDAEGNPRFLFSTYLMFTRLRDYRGMAKPMAMTDESVERGIKDVEDKVRASYGIEGVNRLQEMAKIHWDTMYQLLKWYYDTGLISKKGYEAILENNKYYSPLVDLSKELERTGYVSSNDMEPVKARLGGGFNNRQDPVGATFEMIPKMTRAILRNNWRSSVVYSLLRWAPKDIITIKDGQKMDMKEGFKPIDIMVEGERKTFHIKEEYLDMIEEQAKRYPDLSLFFRITRGISQVGRSLRTEWRGAFLPVNVVRDESEMFSNLVSMGLITKEDLEILKEKSPGLLKELIMDEMEGIMSQTVAALEREGAILSGRSLLKIDEISTKLEKTADMYGAREMIDLLNGETEKSYKEKFIEGVKEKNFKKMLEGVYYGMVEATGGKINYINIAKWNRVAEKFTKTQAYLLLKPKVDAGLLSKEEMMHIIATFVGTPDVTAGGSSRVWNSSVLYFQNVTVQDHRRFSHVLAAAPIGSKEETKAKLKMALLIKATIFSVPVIMGTVIPWIFKNWDDDDWEEMDKDSWMYKVISFYKGTSSQAIKSKYVIPTPFYTKDAEGSPKDHMQIRLPKTGPIVFMGSLMYELLDATVKEHSIDAAMNVAWSILESFNLDYSNMTEGYLTMWTLLKGEDANGREVWEKDDPLILKGMKTGKHIINKDIEMINPLRRQTVFLYDDTGNYERQINMNDEYMKIKNKTQEFKAAATDYFRTGNQGAKATMMRLAEDDPGLFAKASELDAKLKALEQYKDILGTEQGLFNRGDRFDKLWGYVSAFQRISKLDAYNKGNLIPETIKKAQEDLTDRQFKAMVGYLGLFGNIL